MELSPKTKIGKLLDAYPFLLDYLLKKSPKFSKLKTPLMRKTLAKVASLSQAASMGDVDETELLFEIAGEIYKQSNDSVSIINPGGKQVVWTRPNQEERLETFKKIVMRLHQGESVDAVRTAFHDLLKDVSPAEIGAMEQKLVAEGIAESDIKRLCELHVELFTSTMEQPELPELPSGHPLHTLQAENSEAEQRAAHLQELAEKCVDDFNFIAARQGLVDGISDLAPIIRHYERKENQLFPLMEAHGLTAPPQVMWELHDDIRALFKKAKAHSEEKGDRKKITGSIINLAVAVRDMIFKEERILFPMVYETLSDEDWARVRQGEEEIGFAWITPGTDWKPVERPLLPPDASQSNQGIFLDAGQVSPDVLNIILKTLPVDLTFVGSDDRVAYFSQTEERIFPRSEGIIGREVSKCHPPQSVHMVHEILKKFKSGDRDMAEFWLELGGRFIHIRYFAIRTKDMEYAGCLEVSQDVTEIRALKGARRLLEWK